MHTDWYDPSLPRIPPNVRLTALGNTLDSYELHPIPSPYIQLVAYLSGKMKLRVPAWSTTGSQPSARVRPYPT